jgi:lysophospholipase L1-like esterase
MDPSAIGEAEPVAPAAPVAPGSPAKEPPRQRRRVRAFLLRLAALAIGLLAAALLAELAVTLILGEQVKFPRHVVEAPWGLRYNEPGSRYRHRSADGTWFFRINQEGLRDDREFRHEKPPGTKRIVSLGDSFTIGYEVDVEQTFSRVLERELTKSGYRVEVLNAGVSGYSNAEALLYLERELLKYGPDVVVVSFFANDLVDNVRSGLFRLENGRLVPGQQTYVPAGRLGNFLNRNGFFNFLSEQSNAFAFLKERLTYLAKKKMVEENEQNLAVASSATSEANQRGVPKPAREKTQPTSQEALTLAIFDRMWQHLQERGIPLVIQSIPTRTDIGGERLIESFPIKDFDVSRPGLYFLDAKRLLDPSVGKESLYWLRSHFHWTPFSHGLSGKALAQLIRDEGMLGAP